MLFAEADAATAGLYAAITAVLMAFLNWLQGLNADRKARVAAEKKKAEEEATAAAKAAADKQAEEEKAAAIKAALEQTAKTLATKTDETAKAVTDKLETVHKAVNGEGLGGKLDTLIGEVQAMKKWQDEHDTQDNQRYDATIAEILKLKDRPPPDVTPRR